MRKWHIIREHRIRGIVGTEGTVKLSVVGRWQYGSTLIPEEDAQCLQVPHSSLNGCADS
jgi:hypothetical protein